MKSNLKIRAFSVFTGIQLIAGILLSTPLFCRAQALTIDWYTVDSGGAVTTPGSGTTLTLSGTAGQADAGLLTPRAPGDAYTLSGGFWGLFDTGALSSGPFLVTTNLDQNDPAGNAGPLYSLRELIRDAPAGSLIGFDSSLSGQTINLGSGITLAKSVTIDASSLSGGVTVTDTGNVNYRLFTVAAGTTVDLRGLTLAHGGGSNFNNADSFGGAVLNSGTLSLTGCTLSGNTARSGGAIRNDGLLTLTRCTLFDNAAVFYGGAVSSTATTVLIHCTVAGNSAGSGGGGIASDGATSLTNTIIADNTAPAGSGVDFRWGETNALTRTGANIIRALTNLNGGPLAGTGTISTADPLLAPLENYGGPTKTMALKPGSPARDAAQVLVPTLTSDQRGFPVVNQPDIGAYEAGTVAANYNAFIWESLAPATTVNQHAEDFDFDNDGQANISEWMALTNPESGGSAFGATGSRTGENLTISFLTAAGRTYTLQQSDSLGIGSWIDSPSQLPLAGNGNTRTFTVPATVPGVVRRLYRVTVSR